MSSEWVLRLLVALSLTACGLPLLALRDAPSGAEADWRQAGRSLRVWGGGLLALSLVLFVARPTLVLVGSQDGWSPPSLSTPHGLSLLELVYYRLSPVLALVLGLGLAAVVGLLRRRCSARTTALLSWVALLAALAAVGLTPWTASMVFLGGG